MNAYTLRITVSGRNIYLSGSKGDLLLTLDLYLAQWTALVSYEWMTADGKEPA